MLLKFKVSRDSTRARDKGQEEPRVGKTPKSVNPNPEITSYLRVNLSLASKAVNGQISQVIDRLTNSV